MCAVLASVRNTVCLVYNQRCGFITGKRYKTGDDDDDDDVCVVMTVTVLLPIIIV